MPSHAIASTDETLDIPSRANLCVGDVSVALRGEDSLLWDAHNGAFAGGSGTPEITVAVERSSNLLRSPSPPDFDSGALWTLFCDHDDFVFDFASPVLGAAPYKRMRTNASFTQATITMNVGLLGRRPVSALEYPTDELLVTNYLACHQLGVEVHGCGLIDPLAGGQLFLGHSGAGKSTTTRIWETFRNAQILSDDRIILRLRDGELWMHGTPWHGEAAFASPGKAKIDRIFILQHGQQNEMKGLSRANAVGELFARCFPPFHSASGLERTLDFIHRALQAVPCYEFQFVPDQSAVKAVLEFHD
jgi:hypothetical protein